MLAALSHIQPEELQHVMDEIEAEVKSRIECVGGCGRVDGYVRRSCLPPPSSTPLPQPSSTSHPQVASRVKRLRLACEHHALSLRNAFHVELMRIPKGVRHMSLRAFSEQYGQVRTWVDREVGRCAASVCLCLCLVSFVGGACCCLLRADSGAHTHTHTRKHDNRTCAA